MVVTAPGRSGAPPDDPASSPAKVLIEEARHRQRRRWRAWIAVFVALALVGGVLGAVLGGGGGGREANSGAGHGGQEPFGTCDPCTQQSSASALAQGHWTNLPPAPIAPRIDEAAVWTGRELVIWGGAGAYGDVTFGNGAAYDPATRRWHRLPPSPLGPRWGVSAVWTGTDVFIWGGVGAGADWSGTQYRDGALYDPATMRWTVVPATPTGPGEGATALWTGHDVIVLGGRGAGTLGWRGALSVGGAAYDPVTGRWHTLPPFPRVAGEQGVLALASGWNGRAVVATAVLATVRSTALSARWAPGGSRWIPVATPPSLARAVSTTAVWTGRRFAFLANTCPISVGDLACIDHLTGGATTFNPNNGSTTALPRSTALALKAPGVAKWTGRAILAVPGTGKGAAYDPATRRWRRLPATSPFGTGVVSVWTGRQLIVWGGVYQNTAIPGRALVAQ